MHSASSSIFLIADIALATLLGSLDYFDGHASHAGEYFALVLFGAVGMMLMTCSVELLMVFIGLEISSISSPYIMAGMRKGGTSSESIDQILPARFVRHGLSSCTASRWPSGLLARLRLRPLLRVLAARLLHDLAFLALAMMIIGLGFKVSAAPFHIWTPDVYQGAPAPVVGFMSTTTKATRPSRSCCALPFRASLRCRIAGRCCCGRSPCSR